MKYPSITIIIPCFNQSNFLVQCLKSISEQTFNDWECIIVDDGSTDETREIVNQFENKDKRFTYIYQDNQGVSSARNYGYKASKGKYIQFLDGDDFLALNKLKLQYEFMQNNPDVGVCYTNHEHYYEKTNSTKQYKFKILDGCPLSELLYEWDRGVSLPIHSALIRKSIWLPGELPYPLDYNSRYEDWIFWIKIASKGIIFKFLNENMAFYRIHNSNFSTNWEQITSNFIKAMFYIKNIIPENQREQFINSNLHFAIQRYSDYQINIKIYQSPLWKLTKIICRPILMFLPKKIKQKLKYLHFGFKN